MNCYILFLLHTLNQYFYNLQMYKSLYLIKKYITQLTQQFPLVTVKVMLPLVVICGEPFKFSFVVHLLWAAPWPLPLPGSGWGDLMFPGGPPLGPGARVTGRLGFWAASESSFCTNTPFPAVPGFVLVVLVLSTTISGKTNNTRTR